MSFLKLLGLDKPATEAMPPFIREIVDIRGVRIMRLQGPVGKEIGAQAQAADEQAGQEPGAFTRPLIFDFRDTTECDFSTVSYLVHAVRRRIEAGKSAAGVGIINAPPRLLAEFEIAKLDTIFRVFETEEEAIRELSAANKAR